MPPYNHRRAGSAAHPRSAAPPYAAAHHRHASTSSTASSSSSASASSQADLVAGPSQPTRRRPPPYHHHPHSRMLSRNASSSSTASNTSLASTSSSSSLASSSSSCATSVSSSSACPSPASYAWSSAATSGTSSSLPSQSHGGGGGGGVAKRRASPAKGKVAAAVRKGTPREVVVDEARKLAEEQQAAATAAAREKEGQQAKEYATLQMQMSGLCELQYMDEVREYMYDMEGKTRAAVETIDLQPELQWYMRPYLLDFLIEIHQQYRLRPETLYLAVNIIDRYVSKRIVFKKHYQLVGCASLWIAAKFEDAKDRVPTVQDLSAMCCGAYDESAFIQMEGHVLSTIGWVLGHPTAEAWLRLRCVGGGGGSGGGELQQTRKTVAGTTLVGVEEQKTQHVARFLMEVTLFHRAFVGLRSSDIAAASLLLARFIVGKSRRPADETAAVLEIVALLDAHLGERLDAVSSIVVKKYSFSFYSRASTVVSEFYLAHRRFSPLRWNEPLPVPATPVTPSVSINASSSSSSSSSSPSPARSARMQRTPQSAVASSSSRSFVSSPTSSVASCGMMDAVRSPATSSDGGGMMDEDDEDLAMGVDTDATELRACVEDDDMTLAEPGAGDEAEEEVVEVVEEVVVVDDEGENEPMRYALACGDGVAVSGNLRDRDRKALRQMHDAGNVMVPMSV